jgi:hypothetical protein
MRCNDREQCPATGANAAHGLYVMELFCHQRKREGPFFNPFFNQVTGISGLLSKVIVWPGVFPGPMWTPSSPNENPDLSDRTARIVRDPGRDLLINFVICCV